jgi:hypothetical protein
VLSEKAADFAREAKIQLVDAGGLAQLMRGAVGPSKR